MAGDPRSDDRDQTTSSTTGRRRSRAWSAMWRSIVLFEITSSIAHGPKLILRRDTMPLIVSTTFGCDCGPAHESFTVDGLTLRAARCGAAGRPASLLPARRLRRTRTGSTPWPRASPIATTSSPSTSAVTATSEWPAPSADGPAYATRTSLQILSASGCTRLEEMTALRAFDGRPQRHGLRGLASRVARRCSSSWTADRPSRLKPPRAHAPPRSPRSPPARDPRAVLASFRLLPATPRQTPLPSPPGPGGIVERRGGSSTGSIRRRAGSAAGRTSGRCSPGSPRRPCWSGASIPRC